MIVEEREYARMLGYPWGTLLEGDVRHRAVEATAWYEQHGKPRVYCVTTDQGVTITAISAGPEAEAEVQRLWDADIVDQAYFLDRYSAAVVEKLAAERGEYVSPGTRGMSFEMQFELFAQISALNPEIEMLPSGMLRPKNSLLAVVTSEGKSNPCSRCDMPNCSFRRKPA